MAQFDRNASIERIDNPEPDTEERKKQADVIDELWHTDATISEMAEEAGYSRQHVINTLESHYNVVERSDETSEEETIEVPKSVLDDREKREAFLRGYETGFSMGKAT